MRKRFVKLWVDLWKEIGHPMYYLLFVYLLTRAEPKDTEIAKRGQVRTSHKSLAKNLGMTESSIRRGLQRLALLGLTDGATDGVGTLVTICNYDGYNGAKSAPTPLPTTSEEDYIYISALADLDGRLGTKFSDWKVKEWTGFVNGRVSEGATLADFVAVHECKVAEWKGTDMARYLTPGTLYRPSKFWKYREQARLAGSKNNQGVADLL